MKLEILASDYHRNGVCGQGFKVFLAKDEEARTMLVVQFPPEASKKVGLRLCAAFEVAKLAAGNIRFGENSWRGDDYECGLPPWDEEATP